MSHADTILDQHWDGFIPVDIECIVKKEGILIDQITGWENYHLSGIASIDLYGRRTIAVNTNNHSNRRRFTIAHELGHHVLGHVTWNAPQHRDDDRSFSGNNRDWVEVEANNFAAEILMPKVAVDYMIRREGVTDISELAEKFYVSEQAMYFRMLNLGYIR